MKRNIRTPFFVVNPKAYLYGEGSLALALEADKLAEEYDVDIFFTAQACDLSMIAKATKHLIVTAQHMDGILPGRGTGSVLPEAIKNAGAEVTFLNHAEHSLSISQLVNAVRRAKELDIIVLICADRVAVESIAKHGLSPLCRIRMLRTESNSCSQHRVAAMLAAGPHGHIRSRRNTTRKNTLRCWATIM